LRASAAWSDLRAVEEHQLRYEGWRVVGACSVSTLCVTIPLYTFAVFLRPVSDEFAWSREAVSSAFGSMTLVAAGTAPLIGNLLDRFGARRIILPSLALSGCAVASLVAMTSTLWHLRIVFAVLGVATMGASPVASSRAVFGWFDACRGRALGLMISGAAASAIVGPPVAQALIRLSGWRMAWLACGLFTLLVALPAAALFIRDHGPLPQHPAAAKGSVPIRAALRTRVFWILVTVVFGSSMATSGALVHLVALLADRGVPPSTGVVAVSALGAASLAGRILTGWLLDRFDARRVSTVLLTMSAGGVFLLAGAHSIWMGTLAAACIGFGTGGELDVTPYLLSRHFGLRSLSTLYGFNWTAWGIAGAFGAVMLGRSFDATGSYSRTLIELGVVTLGSAGLMWMLPATPRRVPSAAPAEQPV
jgi:MFS family permease